jgi:hypothetical protein
MLRNVMNDIQRVSGKPVDQTCKLLRPFVL